MSRLPVWARWLVGITLVRGVFAALTPPLPQEAYHWDYAAHLDWSYYDHPGMIAWSIALGRVLFGDTPLGIRFVPLLFAAGTTAILARTAKKLYGEPAANWAVLLQTIQPITFLTAASGFPDSPMLFFWAATMALVWEALSENRPRLWIPAGVTFGLGMISKYTIVFFGVSMVLYLLTSAPHRRVLATPWPYLAAILALACFTPVLWWNSQNDWASFRFQGLGRFHSANEFSPIAALKFLGLQLGSVVPLTFPVAALAIRRAPRSERPEERYLFWCWAPMFVFFFAVSWMEPTHILWPLPSWLGVTVLTAGLLSKAAPTKARRYGGFLAVFSALVLGLASIHAAFQIPKIPPLSPMHGWKLVAEKVRQLQRNEKPDTFILGLGPKYYVASQLAYHLQAPFNVLGRSPLGEEDQQFDFWCDPKALEGRDAIIVLEEFRGDDELEAKVRKVFRRVEPEGHLTVVLRGGKPMRFALYRGRGYVPPTFSATRGRPRSTQTPPR